MEGPPTERAAAAEAGTAAAISAAPPLVRPRQREPETAGPAAAVRRGRRAEEVAPGLLSALF